MVLATLIPSILAQSFQAGWRTDGGVFSVIVTDGFGKHRLSGSGDSHAIAIDDKTQDLAEILQKMEAVSDLNCIRRAVTSALGVDAGAVSCDHLDARVAA